MTRKSFGALHCPKTEELLWPFKPGLSVSHFSFYLDFKFLILNGIILFVPLGSWEIYSKLFHIMVLWHSLPFLMIIIDNNDYVSNWWQSTIQQFSIDVNTYMQLSAHIWSFNKNKIQISLPYLKYLWKAYSNISSFN